MLVEQPRRPLAYKSAESEAHRFVAIAADMDMWLTLDEWVAHMTDCGFWSAEFDGATWQAKREVAKRILQGMHDHQLWPLFGHVFEEHENGETVHYYRLERTFEREDYQEAAKFHAEQPGPIHRKRAQGYEIRCQRKYGCFEMRRN